MKHLFFLPFDHRAGIAELAGISYPNYSKKEHARVQTLKQIIYEGFLRVWKMQAYPGLHILVDEEFGAPVLRDAKKRGVPFVLTMENSGQNVLSFAGKSSPLSRIRAWKPAYAKVLIHEGPRGDHTLQHKRLVELSRACQKTKTPFLLELLLEAPKKTHTADLLQTIKHIQDAGVEVDVWKLEGLPKAADWKRVRSQVGGADIVVLGHNESMKEALAHLKAAKQSGVVQGFAVGRTIFVPPLRAYLRGRITKTEASRRIAYAFQKLIEHYV